MSGDDLMPGLVVRVESSDDKSEDDESEDDRKRLCKMPDLVARGESSDDKPDDKYVSDGEEVSSDDSIPGLTARARSESESSNSENDTVPDLLS
mmetsp:Transcript_27239/g.31527  ORF Transcript_27239/g.31527 Transcript_27239/m.31527 type:complete len:94 (+) Transcript_27239:445-726(+)